MTDNMSADELFILAEQRKKEEEEQQRETHKEEVNALKAKLKEINKEFNRKARKLEAERKSACAVVEAEIAQLTGKPTKKGSARVPGISANVIEILQAHGETSTADIRAKLNEQGLKPKNMAQTMAYLKNRGKVVSTGHGVYKLA